MSPVVAWLCHEECPESGGVFEAAGGWVGKCKLYFLNHYFAILIVNLIE